MANGNFPSQSASDTKRPNVAIYVTKSHQLYQKEVPYPSIGPDECIVHVRCTGICGSEIHFWKAGGIGDCRVEHDLVLGHESAGDVVEVGENVKDFKPGDRVSIEPGVTCWECKMCVQGRYNLCPKVKFSGTPPSDGTMTRFVAHPARFLHKIPDSLTYAHGALVEPFSVALGAIERARPRLGQSVLVCGAGPVGLATALCARAAGAFPVVITDLEANRLEQARSLGFDRTVQVQMNWDRHQLADKVREAAGANCIPEIAFECTGAESSITGAVYALEDGGTLLQVGCGKPDITLPLMAMGFREVNIVTSFRYKQTWEKMIRLFEARYFGDIDKLITHTVSLDKAIEGFELCVNKEARAIKVQIVD